MPGNDAGERAKFSGTKWIVMLRCSKASGPFARDRRSFRVPEDDDWLRHAQHTCSTSEYEDRPVL